MEKTAYFKTLGVVVPFGRFEDFCGESEVESLKETINCYKNAHFTEKPILDTYTEGCRAASLVFGGGFLSLAKYAYIFYEPAKDRMEKTLLLGHEEAHVLDTFGQINELETAIRKNGIKLKTGLFWLDFESRANIGGIYACLRKGCTIEEIKDWLGKEHSKFLTINKRFCCNKTQGINFEEFFHFGD